MKSHSQKVEEGLERAAEWKKLTTEMKLRELDRRLGKGVGATRQRAKLSKEVKS